MKQLSRRAFIANGTLLLSASSSINSFGNTFSDPSEALSFGIVTDLHYSDKAPAGSRHYRESIKKLETASEQFKKSKPKFVVELGDLIDAADSIPTELGYLKRINQDFAAICENRHYVLGNHCVHTLTKQEFLDGIEKKESYYSFDEGGIHFVVLDSCFRSDGEPYGRKNFKWTDPNIPQAELDWLEKDLTETKQKVVVFAHQRLDVANRHGVKNAEAVRRVLSNSKKVLAVFQGHSHANDHKEIDGIHYCTMVAMVEGTGETNNAFSLAKISANGDIAISGFVKQKSYDWQKV